MTEALESVSRSRTDDDPGVVSRLLALGRFYLSHDRPAGALPLLVRVHAALSRAEGERCGETHAAAVELSNALTATGDLVEATSILRDHYASVAREVGPEHPSSRDTASRLADLFERAGDRAESEVWQDRARFWDRS